MRALRTKLFGISLREATFERRGFPECDERSRLRLESIGTTFLSGYLASIAADTPAELTARLEEVELERRGFAYEGAGMGLALMDMLLPWKKDRWQTFLEGSGSQHYYMMIVGLGWALARMRRKVEGALAKLDPLHGWLALDGYGFHEAYFHWHRVMIEHQVPARLNGYARRAFDQGVGRALWFINGADVVRVAEAIARFPEVRRRDLWSGVGLACAYAGGVGEERVRMLLSLSGEHRPALAQGVVFAAETRRRAGNIATHTALASRIICERTVEDTADLALKEREALPFDWELPAYEIWRVRIQSHFGPADLPRTGSGAGFETIDYHDSRSISHE